MRRQWIYGLCITAIFSGGGGAVRAGIFTDNFDTPHDFLADGIVGTGWDGFLGAAAGETASAINASMDRPGELYLASAGGYWSDPWTPLGPFLYKVIRGDFVATVRVSDYAGTAAAGVYYNNCGLMARVATNADAGAGEDWISIDYFPLYGVGNIVRYANNGARSEDVGGNGTGWNGHRYLQLERVGDTFYLRTSTDGENWVDYPDAGFTGLNRPDLNGLAVQVGVHQATFTSSAGYAAFEDLRVEGPLVISLGKAYGSVPANKATDVPRDVVLSWAPAETAVAHDLYFGTAAADVAAASRTDPLGVAVATAMDANNYDLGSLEFGQTYYWRVDEVEDDGTIDRGDLWSFAVEPYSYPITGIMAVASSEHIAATGPEKTIDGSGLDDDQHSDDSKSMWISLKNAAEPAWIRYEFDAVYKVDHVLVWNSNQATESALGVGVKDAVIEYSTDGNTWTTLGDVELTQAAGEGEPLSPEVVDLGGVVAKYVKLTISSNWGGLLKQYSLSEVRFYSVPVSAREPDPADGASDVDPQTILSWRAGREAASHEVSLSTDEQAVIGGTADVVTVSEPQYEISLDLDQSYFWKVVEVNDVEDPAAWEGDLWSFTTAEYIVVDDFESYTNDMEAETTIWHVWIDGLTDKNSGSTVGWDEAPFAERTLVHGGEQSMPLRYDHTSFAFSEAKRTFASSQDWTQHGVKTLVVNFHGLITNTPAPLYVKINDTKVIFNAGAGATALPLWKQWNIDLAATGANLKNVKSLTIGIGDGKVGGTGTIYVDDVRLYGEAPSVVAPVDPGSGGIVANYTFDGTVQDSSGRNNHGTITGDAGYEDAPGYGQALIFNGINAYVDLPIGSVISSLTDMTISVYVNFAGASGDWQRIFDFGSSTTNYMFLTPRTTVSGPMRFAIRTDAVGEQMLTSPMSMPTGWHQVAVVIDGTAMTMRLYLDGALVASGVTSLLPRDLGNTTQNWLGESRFEADALFTGSVGDLRIYDRALSEAEVRYLAGDR